MATIPPPTDSVEARIYAHLAAYSNDPPRPHLGPSVMGHKCDRWLWLSFRWAVVQRFDGRILRLFRRGHLEEVQLVQDMRAAGITVQSHDAEGRQFRFEDGHFAGSCDGFAGPGVPGAPKAKHVVEFKTHGRKSFERLKDGVQKAMPAHYDQMQLYMLKFSVDRALYVAVCKDDDRIYSERVALDLPYAMRLEERAQRIIASDRLPPPLSTDPTWYECKLCAGHEFCHGTRTTKQVNCRTCAHSTAERDGRWTCGLWQTDIPDVAAQRAGCEAHVLHPDLVPWVLVPSEDGRTATYLIDGTAYVNGEGGWTSGALIADQSRTAAP